MTTPDPRLQQMAADATARGLEISWHEGDRPTQLLILPVVAPADPARSADSLPGRRAYGLGLGVAMTPDHQESPIICWAWHEFGWLVPWPEDEAEGRLLNNWPPERDLEKFPVVRSLDEALALFDSAVGRWVSEMRQFVVDTGEAWQVDHWCNLRPLAATA